MTPWTAAHQASLLSRISESLLILMSIESGGQSIRASASALLLPMNVKSWFPLELTGLILQSKGLWRVFYNTTVQKDPFFNAQSLWSYSHPYMTTEKTMAFTIWSFVGKVMSLLSNMVSRFVSFPSKELASMAEVTIHSDFGVQEKKISLLVLSSSICHEVMGPDPVILVFLMLNFQPAFSLLI